jgi:Uma2 family endonuclease
MQSATIQQRNPIFFPREQPFSSTEIKTRPRYTEAEFYQFSAANPDLRIELDKNGTLIIMPRSVIVFPIISIMPLLLRCS